MNSSVFPISTNQTIVVNDATNIEIGDFVIGSGFASGTTVNSAIVGTTITLSSSLINSMTSGKCKFNFVQH